MGAADVVPGVSGGTIAFVTGIYAELIESITRVNPTAIKKLKNEGLAATWEYINGTFLLTLGLGIVTAIISLANLIHYLLDTYPIMVWSFFFGLILASFTYITRSIKRWNVSQLVALLSGCGIAAYISLASPTEVEPELFLLFVAGSVAVCAMILPGISGSFILLLMGLYGPIIEAVQQPDILLLAVLATGALFGLLSFSHLLKWLLDKYQPLVLSLLCGFLLGSLVKVWPWKETSLTRINRHGEEVPFIQSNILPALDSQILLPLVLMIVGAGLVLLLEQVAKKEE